jgi:hypothetical protein
MNSNELTEASKNAREKILEQLKQKGEQGLTKSALPNSTEVIKALESLVQEGKVANLGTGKPKAPTYYVFLANQTQIAYCLNLVVTKIKKLTEGTKPALISKSSLEKELKLPSKAKSLVAQGLNILVKEHWLIPLKVAGNNYFLPVVSLQDYFSEFGKLSVPFSSELAMAAYRRLVDSTRSPEILIADLQAESNLPLEALQKWLLTECREHRAVPGRGEPTVATSRQLECALIIEREPFLYIKFIK